MAVNAKIKEDKKDTVVGFAGSGLPLGQRSQSDINHLAILAQESNNPTLIQLFDELPSLEDLKRQRTDTQLTGAAKATTQKSETSK